MTVDVRARRPGRRSTASASRSLAELFLEANAIGGRHGLGMSDQIENRVIEAKSRGIYEAPGMALLHIAYERLLSRSTTRTRSTCTSPRAPARPPALRGRWYDPEAMLLKEALARWVAPRVTGTVDARASPRRRLHDPRHAGRVLGVRRPTSSRWRRPRAPFTPEDRIGALEMQTLGVLDNRNLLRHMLDVTRQMRGPESSNLADLLEQSSADPERLR